MWYNGDMRSRRHGFTLVEVALFLAITGLLFIGIVAGVQNSMFQQRYNDSVQSFAEFLRRVYSQTTNVHSVGNGRSDIAIYGKLVVFGQAGVSDTIYVYDVVGNASGSSAGGTKEAMKGANANVVVATKDGVALAGEVEEYKPRWGAAIQTNTNTAQLFKGALLILRHPRSGTVNTYIYNGDNGTFNVNSSVNNLNNSSTIRGFVNDSNLSDAMKISRIQNALNSNRVLSDAWLDKFEIKQVDFCVNPNGNQGGVRRDVRVVENARNASGVEVISADDPNRECKEI